MAPPTQPVVHHVALTVSDLDVSIPWYERVFNISYQVDIPHDGGVGKLLSNGDRSLMFVLHSHDSNDGRLFSERTTGLDHVGLAVTTRRELEAWGHHLDALGVVLADNAAKPSTRSQIIDAPYASVIVFRDPDNIQLELFAPAATRDSV
jgi:catechol 2,3-dioxygenase-like lactoylglutathione lyase family enzyme